MIGQLLDDRLKGMQQRVNREPFRHGGLNEGRRWPTLTQPGAFEKPN
jgi:hypothetical protein